MKNYPEPVKLVLTEKDGTVKEASFATCLGALNLLDKLGVDWGKVKGKDVSFTCPKGKVTSSYSASYLMGTGTGKAWTARKASEMKASLKKASPKRKKASPKASPEASPEEMAS